MWVVLTVFILRWPLFFKGRFCCTQYYENPVPVKRLKFYKIQKDTDYCNIKAVMWEKKSMCLKIMTLQSFSKQRCWLFYCGNFFSRPRTASSQWKANLSVPILTARGCKRPWNLCHGELNELKQSLKKSATHTTDINIESGRKKTVNQLKVFFFVSKQKTLNNHEGDQRKST